MHACAKVCPSWERKKKCFVTVSASIVFVCLHLCVYLLQPKTGDFILAVADQSMSTTVEFLSNSTGSDQFYNHQQFVSNNNTEILYSLIHLTQH